MGPINDGEHELELAEEKLHAAEQVRFSFPRKYYTVCCRLGFL